MKTKTATYATAIAFGTFSLWRCGRCFNNRGDLGVWRLGSRLWRGDSKGRTTVAELVANGWERVSK